MAQLTKLSANAPPRANRIVVIGGGTLGDLGTVLAHLNRRGLPLTHVPTTLLAAVDSSVGGKGAVHARSKGQWIKNAWGVFHYADDAWLCPKLWSTLSPEQYRQGAIEAFKMELCLGRLDRWPPESERALVERARKQKQTVCEEDPYDSGGLRRVLNYGHTFGHAFESLVLRVAHGDAVGLGILCALDLGRAQGLTPEPLAQKAEAALGRMTGNQGRRQIATLLSRSTTAALAALISADKKGASLDAAHFVLLEREGRARVHRVARHVWESKLLPAWKRGERP